MGETAISLSLFFQFSIKYPDKCHRVMVGVEFLSTFFFPLFPSYYFPKPIFLPNGWDGISNRKAALLKSIEKVIKQLWCKKASPALNSGAGPIHSLLLPSLLRPPSWDAIS